MLPARRCVPGAITGIVLGVLAPALGFLGLALWIGTPEGAAWDRLLLIRVQARRTPVLDAVMGILTNLGSVPVVAGTALYLVGELLRFRQVHEAALVLIGVGGAAATGVLFKHVMQRPTVHLGELSAGHLPPLVEHLSLPSWHSLLQVVYSFPSNHTVGTTALGWAIVLLSWPTAWRWQVAVPTLLAVLSVGYSRVYLGVHYPTDVLAGWALGTAWVASILWIARTPRIRGVVRSLRDNLA